MDSLLVLPLPRLALELALTHEWADPLHDLPPLGGAAAATAAAAAASGPGAAAAVPEPPALLRARSETAQQVLTTPPLKRSRSSDASSLASFQVFRLLVSAGHGFADAHDPAASMVPRSAEASPSCAILIASECFEGDGDLVLRPADENAFAVWMVGGESNVSA